MGKLPWLLLLPPATCAAAVIWLPTYPCPIVKPSSSTFTTSAVLIQANHFGVHMRVLGHLRERNDWRFKCLMTMQPALFHIFPLLVHWRQSTSCIKHQNFLISFASQLALSRQIMSLQFYKIFSTT